MSPLNTEGQLSVTCVVYYLGIFQDTLKPWDTEEDSRSEQLLTCEALKHNIKTVSTKKQSTITSVQDLVLFTGVFLFYDSYFYS